MAGAYGEKTVFRTLPDIYKVRVQKLVRNTPRHKPEKKFEPYRDSTLI